MTIEHIPFEVDTSRIIELLAKQIYQSPLALLRENVQNAFDAIRERLLVDKNFNPEINITIDRDRITIVDNGIGMSTDELKRHFWTAGSSSKNTPEARAAGVVGTFGIGAMANFGVARTLIVETESFRTKERSLSIAYRDRLSLRDDCVELSNVDAINRPGTKIVAELAEPGSISVDQAKIYVTEFVQLSDIPITLNHDLLSQAPISRIVPEIPAVYHESFLDTTLGNFLRADVSLSISSNASIRISLDNLFWNQRHLAGSLVLGSGLGTLRTARSGFGLAIAPVSSAYGFGGVADLLILEPTAGREAITSDGIQLLQSMLLEVDKFTSEKLANLKQCNASTPFMSWAINNSRIDLVGKITIDLANNTDITLQDAVDISKKSDVAVYGGVDPTVIKTFSTEKLTLLIYSRTHPRRQCQEMYLARHPTIQNIPDKPTVSNLEAGPDLTGVKWGVAFRLESIISEDYFVEAEIAFGIISHGVAVLLDDKPLAGEVRIILGARTSSVITLLQVFETHTDSFRSLAKDFVRTVIFPHIAGRVPSSTRQGAEAFIEAMRRKREMFEYDADEQDNLPSIWAEYKEGRITLENAIDLSKFSVRTNVQYVEGTSAVKDVVPDLIENEGILRQPNEVLHSSLAKWGAEPPILRTDSSSSAKLITIEQGEPALRGYRCFIALAPRAYSDFGDFFTQPHSTSVVWGGQKTLFIFIHHSNQFGVYYDMQTSEFVGEHAGGGSQQTCTIILKDKIYIPIPSQIQSSFVPFVGQKKRFEIKSDLIRTGQTKTL